MSPLAREIMAVACEVFDITEEQFLSRRKTEHIAEARWCCWLILREVGNQPFIEIGHEFGRYDHGTVIHGCRRLRELIPINAAVRTRFDAIKKILFGKDTFWLKVRQQVEEKLEVKA